MELGWVCRCVPVLTEAQDAAFEWWMIPVALAVFLLGGGGLAWSMRRSGSFRKIMDEEEDEAASEDPKEQKTE